MTSNKSWGNERTMHNEENCVISRDLTWNERNVESMMFLSLEE
jgi:hypothetical protein